MTDGTTAKSEKIRHPQDVVAVLKGTPKIHRGLRLALQLLLVLTSLTAQAGSLLDAQTSQAITSDTTKCLVLIHGWNPGNQSDMFESSDTLYYLKNILLLRFAGTGWKLATYGWEQEAATGSVVQTAVNDFDSTGPNLAAEHALTQGEYLGLRLNTAAPELRQVHFVAHSAGSWAAREAARKLLELNPYVIVQITLLDPYIPGSSLTAHSQDNDAMVALKSVPGNDRIFRIENYYAKDTWLNDFGYFPGANLSNLDSPTVGTHDTFSWRSGIDINQQVDWGVSGSTWHRWYDYHGGPVEFYADNVKATIGGQAVEPGQDGLLCPFNYQQTGFHKSLFYEAYLLPQISANPVGKSGAAGTSLSLNITGQRIDRVEWFKLGGAAVVGTGLTLNVLVGPGTVGEYVARASNRYGLLYSAKAKVSALTPDAPVGLAAAAVSTSRVDLTWKDLPDELGYRLERRLGSLGSWVLLPALGANATSYSDTGLASGTTYFYRVRAYNVAGDSSNSTTASATTLPAAGTSFTLSLQSSGPSSGVQVYTCLPSGSCAGGITPASRSFSAGAVVTATCSSTLAGGQVFQKWLLEDGTTASLNMLAEVTMNGPHTLTAVYGMTPPPSVTVSSLAIEGPSSVDERSGAQFRARATYTDGSSAYVVPTWSEDSSAATISADGLLDTDAVSSDGEVAISAAFAAGGVSRTRTTYVTIRNTDAVPTYRLSLNVVGLGEIGHSPAGNTYAQGTVVSIHARPGDGYIFQGWTGDASGTRRDDEVAMTRHKTVTATFVADPSVGGINVTLLPPAAVTDGAAWQYDLFSGWRVSGDAMQGLSPRVGKRVYFKDIPGWITPDSVKADIVGGETTLVSATYREILGSVQVSLTPAEVVTAGARWRLDGGPWLESGATMPDVSTGSHGIQFLAVSGWAAPSSRAIQVSRTITSSSVGEYGPPAGFPVITSVSPRTGPLAGGTLVTIDGVNFQAGSSVSFAGRAAQAVTVVSSTRLTAVSPAASSYGTVALTVTSGAQSATQTGGFAYLNAIGSNIELVGQIGGNVLAVAVSGNLAYYGEGAGLVVSDFSNPTTPIERGRIALPAVVRGIALSGTIAFVADGPAGLYAVDISNPASPAIVGFFDTDGSASGVSVVAGRAYVADLTLGLVILDVANPAAMIRLGAVDTAGNATRVSVGTIGSRQYAFVSEAYTATSGLRVIDVTAPGLAVEVSSVAAASSAGMLDVRLVGTTLYLSDWQQGVKIYDAANPASLIQIGSRDNVGPSVLSVSGSRLYTCGSSLRVADLTVSPVPTNLGYFDLGTGCSDLTVSGSLAFAAMGGGGLRVVSVANPAAMVLRSAAQTIGNLEDVWVSGTTAFIGSGGGLDTVDVSRPSQPRRLGTLAGDRVTDLVVANGIATLVNYGNRNVRVVAVANPAALSLQSTYTAVEPWNVALMGSAPLLAAATRDTSHFPMLDVLNLSSPASPRSTGSVLLGGVDGIASAVATFGSWAFVGRPNAALDVVSLSNPASPQKVGTVPIANFLMDVAVSGDGNFVYVADTALGIQVVDVTTRSAPVLSSVVSPSQVAWTGIQTVEVAGQRLFAYGGGYIVAFDISVPATPRVIGYYDIPGSGYGIAVAGDLIYVADASGGLLVLRLVDVDKPTVAITTPTTSTTYSTRVSTMSLGGTSSDDRGVTRISWGNSRGGGGVASGSSDWQVPSIHLASGLNVITVTAEDANGNLATDTLSVTATLPDTTPPSISITTPRPEFEFAVSAGVIVLSGSAADNQGVAAVAWSNDRGGSGSASVAGPTWSVSGLVLAPGPNFIEVTATDAAGNSGSDSAVIFFAPPDVISPSISIQFPTFNSSMETLSRLLNLSGVAVDNSRVATVSWSNNRGGQGVALGVAPWSVNEIPLQPGLNVIEVMAVDDAGNSSADTIAVTFSAPSCTSFGITPASASPPFGAGSRSVSVTGFPADCLGGGWGALGNGSWITVSPSGGTGSGEAIVYWAQNGSTSGRSGVATIAGHAFAVMQDGQPTGLATPFVTTPAAGHTLVVAGVGFAWTTVAEAAGYDLRVSDTDSGAIRFTGSLAGANSTSTLISLPDGNYSFGVRACSAPLAASQCGTFGTVLFTVTQAAPSGAPTVTFPPEGVNLTQSTQTLSWTAVTRNPLLPSLSYEVFLTDVGVGATVLQITVPSPAISTVFTMPTGQYELKVRACQAACGPWSVPVNFSVTLPTVPVSAPVIGSCTISGGNSLACNWGPVANADTYQVLVVQPPPAGPGGGALTVAALQISATSVTLPVPPGSATVLISACNGDGCGPAATAPISAGGANPSVPNLGTPMAGTVVSGPTVLFTWNRIPGDNGSNTRYRLFVQDLSRQSTAFDVMTRENYYAAYFRAEGARYDALVIANPGLSQIVGPAQGFNVAGLSATAPTMVSPAHNSTVYSGNIQLGWSPVPGATLYEYFVAVLGQQNATARGVTPGLLTQVPLTGSGLGTVYSGIVRACPVGATCVAGIDAGWGPWSNVGGPGVTNFTVIP
jgi:uncharacterized repeat protein (TIGR02543 family)